MKKTMTWEEYQNSFSTTEQLFFNDHDDTIVIKKTLKKNDFSKHTLKSLVANILIQVYQTAYRHTKKTIFIIDLGVITLWFGYDEEKYQDLITLIKHEYHEGNYTSTFNHVQLH